MELFMTAIQILVLASLVTSLLALGVVGPVVKGQLTSKTMVRVVLGCFAPMPRRMTARGITVIAALMSACIGLAAWSCGDAVAGVMLALYTHAIVYSARNREALTRLDPIRVRKLHAIHRAAGFAR